MIKMKKIKIRFLKKKMNHKKTNKNFKRKGQKNIY